MQDDQRSEDLHRGKLYIYHITEQHITNYKILQQSIYIDYAIKSLILWTGPVAKDYIETWVQKNKYHSKMEASFQSLQYTDT